MLQLSDTLRSRRRSMLERCLSLKMAVVPDLQRARRELIGLCISGEDAIRFKKFLYSTMLLAFILTVTSAIAALWLLDVPYCHYVLYPIESAQLAALGQREPLPPRSTGKHHDVNADLENIVNAYLAEHNGTDGVQLLPTRIHFIVVSNKTDWAFCVVAASCAFAGVQFTVLGVDTPYSHVFRFEKYLEFLEREGLRDEDIVVTLDTDVAWTGSDVLPFLQKFARYSPASEATLDLAAVRAWEDYGETVGRAFMHTLRNTSQRPSRPLLQLPPVIFNADDDCHYYQPAVGLFQCFTSDYIMTHLIAAARNGASFFSSEDAARASWEDRKKYADIYHNFLAGSHAHSLLNMSMKDAIFLRTPEDPFFYNGAFSVGRDPAHYLNAGMHVSRAWALRELAKGVLRFAKEQKPRVPEKWYCDQSIIGHLRYYSRIFEIDKDLLFEAGQRKSGGLLRDHFGLPVGLISVDRLTEFMFTSHLHHRHGLGELTPYYARQSDKFLTVLDSDLVVTRTGIIETRPLWSREVKPRCHDVPLPNGSVVPRCSEAPSQRFYPSFLHFAAGSKKKLYRRYREWFAWYFAARRSIKALTSSMHVLNNVQLELWRTNSVQYIPFFAVCPSPFHAF